LFIGACASPVGASTSPATMTASGVADALRSVDPADRACADKTITTFFDAVNLANEAVLKDVLRSASVGVSGPAFAGPDEAVAALLARSRAGERWALVTLDVNGRGWHGGIDFGLRMRRSGPGLPSPSSIASAKGVLDCPAGRVTLFYVG
jgi:hypothetical protein